ncbi:hypothetical protein F8M41_006290 [Gigaspora margarita]|uniref:Uncharacterized protein n=1 Tax=Gigaspora margarita TaxID=4874 RepID=A0A8H3X9C8_GIGMA|nr:hypothetical protein F8M41_006290 [Gigaspora margarita]
MSIAQLISGATIVLTKHDKVNEKSSDVHTIDTESEYSKRKIEFPDIQWPNVSGVHLPEINFSVIILICGVIGIVLLTSLCLIYLCPYCLGFGKSGIYAGSIVSACQRCMATGGPGGKPLKVVLVMLFVIVLVILSVIVISKIH